MSNDGTSWHSDDELASALERALEIPSENRAESAESLIRPEPLAQTASHDFSDLFAALTEPEVRETPDAAHVSDSAEATSDVVFDSPEPVQDVYIADVVPVVSPDASPELAEAPREQVFESLDDFKPRTNFIPVISPETSVDESAPHPNVVATEPEAAELLASGTIPVTSAHVTQPIRWDRKRPSFDEIIFGTSSEEN